MQFDASRLYEVDFWMLANVSTYWLPVLFTWNCRCHSGFVRNAPGDNGTHAETSQPFCLSFSVCDSFGFSSMLSLWDEGGKRLMYMQQERMCIWSFFFYSCISIKKLTTMTWRLFKLAKDEKNIMLLSRLLSLRSNLCYLRKSPSLLFWLSKRWRNTLRCVASWGCET